MDGEDAYRGPILKNRIRHGYKQTVKGGWSFDDTVEMEWTGEEPIEDEAAMGRHDDLLARSYERGAAECRRRNEAEGRVDGGGAGVRAEVQGDE